MSLTLETDDTGLLLGGTADELTALAEGILAAVEGHDPADVIAQLFTTSGVEQVRCVVIDRRSAS